MQNCRSKPKIFILLFLFFFVHFLLVRRAQAQVPKPYVDCDKTEDPEFHSLRPYQASPCKKEPTETALFCGNNLILQEEIKVTPSEANSCQQVDGKLVCQYTISRSRAIEIDLSGADLPIVGNTEKVINSTQQVKDIDSAEKTNEYVSWYLNGVTNKAEYPSIDPGNPEDIANLVNFSGPINKLLPKKIITEEKVKTIKEAGISRHDQVVGCIYNLLAGIKKGQITACYPKSPEISEVRLSDFKKHLPPKEEDYKNFKDYWVAYKRWRGESCIKLPIGSICIDNPLKPNYWGNLFANIPLSSTEDRVGLVETQTISVQPASEDVKITNVSFSNQTPVKLFFPHMEETTELASILQKTYVPKGTGGGSGVSGVSPSGSCDLVNIRTNDGDSLFPEQGGKISGDLSYTANFSCEFSSSTNTCSKKVNVSLSVITKAPKVDELWSRTVAGPAAIFKRIFPKVGIGGAIVGILDIPAATKVSYSGDGLVYAGNPSNERSGKSAELYFPHIGGVSEYFLKGIQTILRPKGFGEPIASGPAAPPNAGPGVCGQVSTPPHQGTAPVSGGACQPAKVGWCSPSTLLKYGWPADSVETASIICNMESGGFTNAFNDGCLCGKTLDYSIGLFQINLLAHCAANAFTYSRSPISCTPLNQSEIDSCAQKYFDPEENIRYALSLYQAAGWEPWKGSASVCGIIK